MGRAAVPQGRSTALYGGALRFRPAGKIFASKFSTRLRMFISLPPVFLLSRGPGPLPSLLPFCKKMIWMVARFHNSWYHRNQLELSGKFSDAGLQQLAATRSWWFRSVKLSVSTELEIPKKASIKHWNTDFCRYCSRFGLYHGVNLNSPHLILSIFFAGADSGLGLADVRGPLTAV
jgi:hypothetical protein